MTDLMTELIAVYTTVTNNRQAHVLAAAATENHLAACVQTEPNRSTDRWLGKIDCQDDIRVLLKPPARRTQSWRSND
jgi:uncharacterized protein involved in tolerance to divalent cations